MKMSRTIDMSDNVTDLIDRNTNRILSPRLNSTNNVNYYFENEEEMRNRGAISVIKKQQNVRVLSINPHEFVPNNEMNMTMLKEVIKKF